MPVKLVIPTALTQHTNNKNEIELNARTVNDALRQLVTAYPNLRNYLYADGDRLRSFINIYLNEADIREGEGEDTAVKDGDTILIVPAIAGGAQKMQDIFFTSQKFWSIPPTHGSASYWKPVSLRN